MLVCSTYRLAGLLLAERGDLVLRVDDDGQWRLDADRSARRMVGSRVLVEGVRAGFDVIDDEAIRVAGELGATRPTG